MILFSVIIPHYNSVALLERLLKTIPVDEKIQVIVIDDKSTENVSEVRSQVIQRKGEFIYNTTERKGAGTARNLGLQKAKGKWLIFADADDFFTEDAFNLFSRYVESEEDIIYFSPISIYEDTGKTAGRHVYYKKLIDKYIADSSKINETAIRYKWLSPCSKIIRRQIISQNEILFDEIPAAEDVMFCMKSAYAARQIRVCPATVYCVTQSVGTLTTKHSEYNFQANVDAFINRYFFIKRYLDMNDFGFWDISGIGILKRAFREGYSIRFIVKCSIYLIEKKVPLISLRGLINSIKIRLK